MVTGGLEQRRRSRCARPRGWAWAVTIARLRGVHRRSGRVAARAGQAGEVEVCPRGRRSRQSRAYLLGLEVWERPGFSRRHHTRACTPRWRAYDRQACCILPPYHPLTHHWSQNALLFPPLLSHALSWTLNMQQGIYITKILNIFETIREYVYICFLVIYRTVSL